MKFLIAMALVAFAAHASAQSCTDVENCLTCANPGPLCEDCPDATVISADRTKCLECSDGCQECTANALDVTTCTKCGPRFYLRAGVCVECTEGCLECHEDNNVVVCDKCVALGYAQDLTQDAKPCIACPSNCKTCSVQADGTTQCSECYSYSGLNLQGYYLKASDKSCKSCPSKCEKCTDNGEGKGICNDCYDDYVIFDDTNDDTKDGTKCLSCPSACAQCSGEVNTGSTAKCTDCKPDMGNYLSSDACTTCGDGCKNCDADGACTECEPEYRQTDTTCTACPSFCLACSLNDDNSVSCGECKTNYGTKPAADKSCDSCGISNCLSCTRASDGSFTCGTCATGYVVGDGVCKSCPAGCNGCTWDAGNSVTKCTACASGYTATVDSDQNCGSCDTVSNCGTCDWDTTPTPAVVECSACVSGWIIDTADPPACHQCPTGCRTVVCKFDSGAAICDDTQAAGSQCDTGYTDAPDSGVCGSCTSGGATGTDANCVKCEYNSAPTVKCTECATGWIIDAADPPVCHQCPTGCNTDVACKYDTTNSAAVCDTGAAAGSQCDTGYTATAHATEGCGSCTSGLTGSDPNCAACDWNTAPAVACSACATGYRLVSGACTKCSANCDDCDANGCKTCATNFVLIDSSKTCTACPSKCADCTYDATDSKAKCKDNQCTRGGVTDYTVNGDGDCEKCPENCNTCEYSSDAAAVICSDNTNCADGFGLKADNFCHACPSNCKDCTADAEDNLICDTCNANYALNDDVCAKCPSNCAQCSNSLGSMECSVCSDGYALDANKACIKCPANCDSCSVSSCKECNSGYALSGDRKTCVACSSAAFENCALCTSIDAASDKANCTACASGYVLEDEEQHLSCKSTSSLSCGSGSIYDNDPECSSCAEGFQLIDDHKCAKMCYSCGNPESGEFVAADQCTIPAGNATATDAKLIPCFSGVCYSGRNDEGKVNAGCDPSPSTCREGDGETCRSLPDGPQLCSRCCTSDKCNTFIAELDGWADNSGTNMAASLLLLAGAALLAAF